MSNKNLDQPLKADKGPNDEGCRPGLGRFDKKMGKKKIKFLNVKYTDKESAESRNNRERAISQAFTLIENFYVHLPLKKTIYAVDPLKRLRLLRDRNSRPANGKPALNNREFFNEMTSIFTELRDLHTTFVLPSPYKDQVVFLPFFIEEFYEEDEEGKEKKKVKKYMVSKIYGDNKLKGRNPSFEEGVVITHWNGIPIEKAVALNGERNAGSNQCARQARGLERMTIRPLKNCLPPEEHYVTVTYEDQDGKMHDLRFCWYIMDEDGDRKARGASNSRKKTVQGALGVDMETELVSRSKRRLYKTPNRERNLKKAGKFDLIRKDHIKSKVYDFSLVNRADLVKFGYFRIYSFDVAEENFFISVFHEKIKPRLQRYQAEGLIIDVRGNGGGHIPAAERLLQVFASKEKVKLEKFQFISTPLTLQLCRNPENEDLDLEKFADSIECAIQTGDTYSQGFTLPGDTPIEKNDEDKYDGPVVLITDALCYSATDIFAAGFKDNHIGKILGVHQNTGAGGANVWNYEFLRNRLDNGELKENPGGENCNCDWDFRVAIRRATRVGDKAGMPLEDLGVKRDCPHQMTRNDLLYRNEDLIVKAIGILKEPCKCEDGKILD